MRERGRRRKREPTPSLVKQKTVINLHSILLPLDGRNGTKKQRQKKQSNCKVPCKVFRDSKGKHLVN